MLYGQSFVVSAGISPRAEGAAKMRRLHSGGSVSCACPRGLSQTKGFTLVEVLVAVLVLAVGLLGLAGLQLTGMKTNDSAERRMRATVAVQDVLERMRFNPQDFIGDNDDQSIGDADVSDEFAEWANYVGLLGLPALPGDSTIAAGWVDCANGNPCGSGNCQVGVGWDDSAGDRAAAELGDGDTRDLENMQVRVCSRIAEEL